MAKAVINARVLYSFEKRISVFMHNGDKVRPLARAFRPAFFRPPCSSYSFYYTPVNIRGTYVYTIPTQCRRRRDGNFGFGGGGGGHIRTLDVTHTNRNPRRGICFFLFCNYIFIGTFSVHFRRAPAQLGPKYLGSLKLCKNCGGSNPSPPNTVAEFTNFNKHFLFVLGLWTLYGNKP